jgi:GDSL-like lipase/acylhydrolase family protein
VSKGRSVAYWCALAGLTAVATALAGEWLVRLAWSPEHPRVAYVRTAFDPDLGLVHITGRHVLRFRRCLAASAGCENVGIRFTINSQGFRGIREARDPAGDPLIVVLGDSMIEGAQVSDEETACHLLEGRLRRRHPDVEVRNLGITSAGLVHYYLRAQRLLADAPSVLIVAVLGLNDFRNSSSRLETFAPMRPHYSTSPDGTRVHFERAPRSSPSLLDRSETVRMLAWLRAPDGPGAPGFFPDAAIYEEPPSPEIAAAVALGREYLERLIREGTARGSRVIVVSLPWRGEWLDEEWAALSGHYAGRGRLRKERPEEIVRAAALAAGATFVSFGDAVGRLPREQVAPLWHRGPDAHFTTEGHRLLAAVLAERVDSLLDARGRAE